MKQAQKKTEKRDQAAERQARWDTLSTTQKIADLDRRLGKGEGAAKQRAKLAAKFESEKTIKTDKVKSDKKNSK